MNRYGLRYQFTYFNLSGVLIALHVMVRRDIFYFALYGAVATIPIASCWVLVGSYYYGQLVLNPLLYVLYNVFPVPRAGPELFGLEAIMYYVINIQTT